MSKIDWTLIIGYPLADAVEYIEEEKQKYRIIMTAPPKKRANNSEIDYEEMRIIGVRPTPDYLELICAADDWSVS